MGKLGNAFRRFMTGRYGTDKLNIWILVAALLLCLVNLFLPKGVAQLALCVLIYALTVWAIFRCFSRNTYKRYQENRRFLQLLDRVKDRKHRYFDCPKCRQQVRVPRGKGRISITCPKCKEKFIRKT